MYYDMIGTEINEMVHGLKTPQDKEAYLSSLLKVMGLLFLGQAVCALIFGFMSEILGNSMAFSDGEYSVWKGLPEYVVAACHIILILGAAYCDLLHEDSPKYTILFLALEFIGCGFLKLIVLVGSFSPVLLVIGGAIAVITLPITGVLVTSTVIPTLILIPGLGGTLMSAVCAVVMPIAAFAVILLSIAQIFG